MSDNDLILEVRNLSKVYGDLPFDEVQPLLEQGLSKDEIRETTGAVVGVDDVSFSVRRGGFFVIMGLSGSGKSTLIRCLIRLVEPSSGEILIDGEDVAAMSKSELRETRRTKFAMVFQHYGLLPHKTVLQNVEYGLKVRGVPKKERLESARAAIERVGLSGWEDERPSALSGGMQQRVGLARALAHSAEVLLMDEPFSGLDPLIRRQLQDEFATLQEEEEITTIFVTHDLDEALRLGDRIAIMRAGEIVQVGTPAELVTNPADDYVARFVAGASPARFMRAESIMDETPNVVSESAPYDELVDLYRRSPSNTIFVNDANGALVGAVSSAELLLMNSHGDNWNSIVKDVVTAPRTTALEDLVPLAVETPFPLAITDKDRRLTGIVNRQILLETVAEDMSDEVNLEDEEAASADTHVKDKADDELSTARQPIIPGE